MPSVARTQEIYDAIAHISKIFPHDTNLTCTLTAHANANTWSAWDEIADVWANTISSLFATNIGHLTSLYIEELSDINAIYMLEVAYGATKEVITNGRFAGATKFQIPPGSFHFWAPGIPAGETVYYRMKTETAVADTCKVHFRYHIH